MATNDQTPRKYCPYTWICAKGNEPQCPATQFGHRSETVTERDCPCFADLKAADDFLALCDRLNRGRDSY